MAIQKDKFSFMETYALPNPITNEKPAVEHRNLGFMAWEKFAVNPNLDIVVAIVGDGAVRSALHRREASHRKAPLNRL